jgi:hypothetical protein
MLSIYKAEKLSQAQVDSYLKRIQSKISKWAK